MTTVSINKEVMIKTVEAVELPAPSFWKDDTSGAYFHLKEDGTVVTVMKPLITVGDVNNSILKSSMAYLSEITREEFLDALKKTQRFLLQHTSNI